ncbi:MAG: YtxH domain-containing protein [Candidatus Rokubacteria bacterium]|nr:YtxH domain-containing protein [Candidatus Rokubacteria bacterium]
MADERSGGDAAGYLGWFFLGALMGAAAALLLTPKTGPQARELLREKGGDFTKRAQEYAKEAQVRASELLDKGRELFEEQSQRLMSAFEAGREAMREEIGTARGEG